MSTTDATPPNQPTHSVAESPTDKISDRNLCGPNISFILTLTLVTMGLVLPPKFYFLNVLFSKPLCVDGGRGVHRAGVTLKATQHISGGSEWRGDSRREQQLFAAERLLAPFVLSQLWRWHQSLPLQRHWAGSTVSEGHFWHDDGEKGET